MWQPLIQLSNIYKYGVVASQKLWLLARTQIGFRVKSFDMVGARGTNQTLHTRTEVSWQLSLPSTTTAERAGRGWVDKRFIIARIRPCK